MEHSTKVLSTLSWLVSFGALSKYECIPTSPTKSSVNNCDIMKFLGAA